MGTHLRLYDSNKTALGLLPEHSGLTTQVALNTPGTLVCDYPVGGVNAQLLDRDIAFAAVINDGVESPDWFLLDDDGDDPAAEAGNARLMRLSGRGLLALLENAQVYPQAHVAGQSPNGLDPWHKFDSWTPGRIMALLIERAKDRGCFPDLTYSFTTTTDSAGKPWPKTYDVTYAAGTNYLTVLSAMGDNGWADFKMSGFTLDMYVPDTVMATDKTAAVLLRLGQQVLEAPRKRSRRGIISDLLGIGDGKNMVEVSNATTRAKYGRREGNASDGRMTTNGSLNSLAQEALKQHLEAKEGITLRLSLDAPPGEVWPIPGKDYSVGHKIAYDQRRLASGAYEALRVRTITWSYGTPTEAPSVSLELNDLFVETSIRTARRVQGIVNGSVVDAPPPSTDPTELPQDTTVPKAPNSVTLDPFTYKSSSGEWFAGVNIAWTLVTENTDATPYADHQTYLIEYAVDGGLWRTGTPNYESPTSIDGLPSNHTVKVRVAAQDSNSHVGAWTESAELTLPGDTTPPAVPSTLTGSTRLGVVTLEWDGKDNGGAAPVDDFKKIAVYRSADPAVVAPAGTFVGDLTGRGQLVVPGLPYDTPQTFTAVAYDTAGNVSDASGAFTITPERSVSDDLADGVVTEGKIGPNAVDDVALADEAVTRSALDRATRDRLETSARTFYGTTPPPAPEGGYITGDLWADEDDGNRLYRYNGSFGELPRTNLITNPGMRRTDIAQVVRRNLLTNPSVETNVGWPSNNPAYFAVSYDTTKSRSGARSLKGMAAAGQVGYSATILSVYNVGGAPVAAAVGKTYTGSVYVAANVKAKARITTSYLDSGGATLAGGTTYGEWVEFVGDNTFVARPTHTTTAPTGTASIRLMIEVQRNDGSNTTATDAAWVDDALLEESAFVQPYFDGATVPVVRCNYAINPNFRATSGTIEVRRNLAPNPVTDNGTISTGINASRGVMTVGSGYLRNTVNDELPGQFAQRFDLGSATNYLTAAPGDELTISADVRTDSGSRMGVMVIWVDAANAVIGSTVVGAYKAAPISDWTRVSATATAPAGTAKVAWYVGTENAGAVVKIGHVLDMRHLLVEKAGFALPYFDGDFGVSDGLTYSWTAGARASASIATGAAAMSYGASVNPVGSSVSWTTGSELVTLIKRTTAYTIVQSPSIPFLSAGRGAARLAAVVTADVDCTINTWVAFGNDVAARVMKPYDLKAGVPTQIDAVYTNNGQGTLSYGTFAIGFHPPNYQPTSAVTMRIKALFVSRDTDTLPVFDGSTTTPDAAYAWSAGADTSTSIATYLGLSRAWEGAANASASTLTGQRIEGYTSTGSFVKGPMLDGIQWADLRDGGYIASNYVASKTGEFYSGKVMVRAIPGETPAGTAVQVRVHDGAHYNAASAPSTYVTVPDDGTPIVIDTLADLAVDHPNQPRLYIYPGNKPIRVSRWDLEKVPAAGTKLGDYFDGALTGAAWTGDADRSTSTYAPGWVQVQDAAIAAARSVADTALTSANGKNKVTHSPNPASISTPGKTVGDTWWQEDASGVVLAQWQWTGAAWSPVTLGSQVIAALDVGKLTGGYVDAAHLKIGAGVAFDNGYNPRIIASTGGGFAFFNPLSVTLSTAGSSNSFVIRTPIPFTGPMVRVKLSGRNLGSPSIINAEAQLYCYALNGGTIYQPTYSSYGDMKVRIRFARDAANKLVLIVDPIGANWRYPELTVNEVGIGYSGASATMVDGWTHSWMDEASLTTEFGATITSAVASRDLDSSHGLTQKWVKTGTTTIDGGNVAADTVTAVQLAVGAATIEKLTIGAIGDERAVNGAFEEVSAYNANLPAAWTQGAVYKGGTVTWNTASPLAGSRSVNLNVTGASVPDKSASIESRDFPVIPGEVYAFKVTAKDSVANMPGFYIGLMGSTSTPGANGGAVWGIANAGVGTVAQELTGQVTIPAGWRYARVIVMAYSPTSTAVHTITVDSVSCRPVVISAQIADGAIEARNIKAYELESYHFSATAITADMVNAGEFYADFTLSGRITTALNGQRVEINFNGIYSYTDTDPDPWVAIEPGWAKLTGRVATGGMTDPHIELGGFEDGAGSASSSVYFYTALPTEVGPGEITMSAGSANATLIQSLPQIEDPVALLPTHPYQIALMGHQVTENGKPAAWRNLFTNPSFENDLNTWGADNTTTLSLDSTTYDAAGGGFQSLKCVAGSGITFFGARGTVSRIQGSVKYGARARVKSSVATNAYLIFQFWDASNVVVGTIYGTSTAMAADTWTTLSVQGTAPASAEWCYVYVRRTTAVTAGSAMWVDNCLLTDIPIGVTFDPAWYFDGDTGSALSANLETKWFGIPHASESEAWLDSGGFTVALDNGDFTRPGGAFTVNSDRFQAAYLGIEMYGRRIEYDPAHPGDLDWAYSSYDMQVVSLAYGGRLINHYDANELTIESQGATDMTVLNGDLTFNVEGSDPDYTRSANVYFKGAGNIVVDGTIKRSNRWGSGYASWTPLLAGGGGWVTYGQSYAPAGYRVMPDGRVQLRGLVKYGSASAYIGMLPADLAPEYDLIFIVLANTGLVRLDVIGNSTTSFTPGGIYVRNYIAGGTNAFVSLEQISFYPATV